jgi:hypothetical protein
MHRLSNIGLLQSADIGSPSLRLNQPIEIMSAVEKKSDTTTGKTALELLEEDDEFEVTLKHVPPHLTGEGF